MGQFIPGFSAIGPRGSWVKRVLNTESDNLIGFWLQDETSGTTAEDSSGKGNDGTYSNVTLADATLLGRPVPLYVPGDSSYLNFYSVGFNSDFDGEEGTVIVPIRVSGAGVWTDETQRTVFGALADSSNYVRLFKAINDNQFILRYMAGGTNKDIYSSGAGSLNWLWLALTWSASGDQVRGYLNGEQDGSTLSSLGSWSGSLNAGACIIGAQSTTPSYLWDGWLGPIPMWSKALTPSQVAYVS